jgi:hypothetical protein
MSNNEQLDMFLTYSAFEHPGVSYPYFLKVETNNRTQAAMVSTEFNALCQLVKMNCYSADFCIDQQSQIIGFRDKSDVMRIKLLWEPIKWIPHGRPGW